MVTVEAEDRQASPVLACSSVPERSEGSGGEKVQEEPNH